MKITIDKRTIDLDNINYWMEDGKYIYDYDRFDTLDEMKLDYFFATLWVYGKAQKNYRTEEWEFC